MRDISLKDSNNVFVESGVSEGEGRHISVLMNDGRGEVILLGEG